MVSDSRAEYEAGRRHDRYSRPADNRFAYEPTARENRRVDKIRVGIIGCGGAATWHALTLANSAEFEVVGLADPSKANLERFRSRVPLLAETPAFDSAEQLFENAELDAVSVITPHTLHYPIVMNAIKRNLHVLCEKPLVCESEHARDILRAADTAGVTVMVSYQRRLDPAYRYMHETITSGALGELRSVVVSCGQRWLENTKGTWRQDPALSGGGMLMDSGSHLVDALLWLVEAPVESVYALVDNAGSPVDINTTATLAFAGGIQAQLSVVGDLATQWMETVIVCGTDGVLRYDVDPQHPWRTGQVLRFHGREATRPLELRQGPDIHEAWLAAIRGEAPNPSPVASAVRVAELTEAIYRSAREQASVRLST
jgi:predicted dehydrogenase